MHPDQRAFEPPRPVRPPHQSSIWRDPRTGVSWDAAAVHWYDERSGQWIRHSSAHHAYASVSGPVPAAAAPRSSNRGLLAALALALLLLAGGTTVLIVSKSSSSDDKAAGQHSPTDRSGRRPDLWPIKDVPLPKPASESELGGPRVLPTGSDGSTDPDFITADQASGRLSYGLTLSEVKTYLPKIVAAGWVLLPSGQHTSSVESWDYSRHDSTELIGVTFFHDSGSCQIEYSRPAAKKNGATGTAIPSAGAS